MDGVEEPRIRAERTRSPLYACADDGIHAMTGGGRSSRVPYVRTCLLGQGAPVGVAVLLNVGDEAHVLLRRPGALVQPHLGAARCPPLPHGCSSRAPQLLLLLLLRGGTRSSSCSSPELCDRSLDSARDSASPVPGACAELLQPGQWQGQAFIYTHAHTHTNTRGPPR